MFNNLVIRNYFFSEYSRLQSLTGFNADPDTPDTVSSGAIIGSVIGTLAVIAAALVASGLLYKRLQKRNKVDQSASTSDVRPIIPPVMVITEAPNSVPPAGY